MSRTVTLPPGCAGFTMQDGTQYRGREGGSVTVADSHAPFIQRQVGGDAGLVGSAAFRQFAGTTGRPLVRLVPVSCPALVRGVPAMWPGHHPGGGDASAAEG